MYGWQVEGEATKPKMGSPEMRKETARKREVTSVKCRRKVK